MEVIMDPVAVQNRLPRETRVNALIQVCNEAVVNISRNILQSIIEASAMHPRDFANKHITQKGQDELSKLDVETDVFSKNILFSVVQQLSQTPTVFTGLTMIGGMIGDDAFVGKFFKEKALPEVQAAADKLNALDPSILEEATSTGVDPAAQQVLQLLNIV